MYDISKNCDSKILEIVNIKTNGVLYPFCLLSLTKNLYFMQSKSVTHYQTLFSAGSYPEILSEKR